MALRADAAIQAAAGARRGPRSSVSVDFDFRDRAGALGGGELPHLFRRARADRRSAVQHLLVRTAGRRASNDRRLGFPAQIAVDVERGALALARSPR